MITRNSRQAQCITTTIDNDFNGILDLSVRFGKTRVGVAIANAYMFKNPGKSVVVIVPSIAVKLMWEKEVEEQKSENHITIATSYQTLSINGYLRIGLLIVDECHKFISPETYRLINGDIVKYDKIIMLTGTLPHKDLLYKLTSIVPIIDTITEKEAIANNWVSNYVEYNIALELTDNEKERYVKYTKDMSLLFAKYKSVYKFITYANAQLFDNEFTLLYSITRGFKNKIIGYIHSDLIKQAISNKMNCNSDANALWSIDVITNDGKLFTKSVNNRNTIMAASNLKLKAVLYILNKLKLKTVIFSESVGLADRIADEYNKLFPNKAISYHSKIESKPLIDYNTGDFYRYKGGLKAGEPKVFSKDKQLEYIIAAFDAGFIDVISAVKALDEGITIPGVESIITTSGSMNPIQYDQRTARGKTYVNEDKVAKIYNIFFDDFNLDGIMYNSRDKEKLMSRQRYNNDVLKINIDEL